MAASHLLRVAITGERCGRTWQQQAPSTQPGWVARETDRVIVLLAPDLPERVRSRRDCGKRAFERRTATTQFMHGCMNCTAIFEADPFQIGVHVRWEPSFFMAKRLKGTSSLKTTRVCAGVGHFHFA